MVVQAGGEVQLVDIGRREVMLHVKGARREMKLKQAREIEEIEVNIR